MMVDQDEIKAANSAHARPFSFRLKGSVRRRNGMSDLVF
jgi:hypothetical protein